MKTLRCAIYTRKSTEEGLEQEYNSLAAQREACEAYIKSQAGEGWRAIAKLYDDGGFSGGSMERPALKALLGEIDAGRIDVVVVYKVDRLTRSLMDFSKIVERFDAKGVSFVSVTQSFNTTTSMGRLTLNVLLSFAQFEREVTGERIRDKISASKKKGMWMGGHVPLGYAASGRTLVPAPAEADLVRSIFDRYLEMRSVTRLADALIAEGARSKVIKYRTGREVGGKPITPGALHYILSNRTYLGEIRHRALWYPGQHTALVDREVFAKVAAALAERALPTRRAVRASKALLIGLLFDDAGHPMTPSFAIARSGKRHDYYVSHALIRSRTLEAGSLPRVGAGLIEAIVSEAVSRVLDVDRDWALIRPRLKRVIVATNRAQILLAGPETDAEFATARLREGEVLDRQGDAEVLSIPFQARRWRGAHVELDARGRERSGPTVDRSLVQLLARAHSVRRAWLEGEALAAIAVRQGMDPSDIVRLARLAYLAPDLVREALAGAGLQSVGIRDLKRLDLPLDWDAQRRLLRAAF